MVTRMGFEPMNVALRGLCVEPLHQRAMMVASVRFELTITESESDALPLGYEAMHIYYNTLFINLKRFIDKII